MLLNATMLRNMPLYFVAKETETHQINAIIKMQSNCVLGKIKKKLNT